MSLIITSHADSSNAIISSTRFVPTSYSALTPEDKKDIREETYQKLCTWYDQCHDVTFERITYLSNGLKVSGICAKPSVINEKTSLPVVIYNRGGVNEYGKVEVYTLYQYFYPLVKAGYVVLASQYRGNDGSEGKDELGGGDLDDVLNLVEVSKQLSYADSTNLFMMGVSRGGMMAYMALRKKIPVKAVVIRSGISDMTLFETLRPDMKNDLESFFSADTKKRYAEYEKRSAVKWAAEIDAPLLLIHGDKDPLVHIDHTYALIEELKRHNKPYELVVYSDNNHMLTKHSHDIVARSIAWFSKFKS